MAMPGVFTSGVVAQFLGVSPRTVNKYYDSGMLTGYRLPQSTDRRIRLESIVAFMDKHGIPMTTLKKTVTTEEIEAARAVNSKEAVAPTS